MDGTRYFVAGSLIDGSGAPLRRGVVLAVREGIIVAIAPPAELPRPDEAEVFDFSHCVLLPPLVDCSVCLTQSSSVNKATRLAAAQAGRGDMAAMVARHVHDCHVHGVLGVANHDGMDGLVEPCSGGGGQEGLLDIRTSSPLGPAGDPAGGDFLRLVYSADIEAEPSTVDLLDHETLCRIHRYRDGKTTVVVANGRQQTEEALAAGCDAIEQGYGMGEDNLKIMAQKDVLWIPSVLRAKTALDGSRSGGEVGCRFSGRYAAPGKPIPGAEALWNRVLTEQLAQLRLARQLGVRTAVGTGAGSAGILHGEAVAEELKLFLKAGYSLEEAICCASKNGADFFGMARLGGLTVGRRATFLLVRGAAQQVPRKLSFLAGIVLDGVPSMTKRKNPA